MAADISTERAESEGVARTFGRLCVLPGIVAITSLALVVLSIWAAPDDVCGPYRATWTWSLIPLGVTCDFSRESDWTGPVNDFRESNTAALIVFLVSTAIVGLLALVGWIAAMLTADRTHQP